MRNLTDPSSTGSSAKSVEMCIDIAAEDLAAAVR